MHCAQLTSKTNSRQVLIEYDESLCISSAKQGDHSAFKELYNRNVGRVYAVCLRILKSKDKAEELTQDVFVSAWNNLNNFREESLFSTWLHRIAVNMVLVSLRNEKRRLSRFVSINSKINNVLSKIHLTGDSIDLEKAISILPEKARIVFLLHDVEGYKHEEISEVMKIAVGTSKAQLSRARKILREALDK